MFLMNKTTGRQEAKKPMLTKDQLRDYAERIIGNTHTHTQISAWVYEQIQCTLCARAAPEVHLSS